MRFIALLGLLPSLTLALAMPLHAVPWAMPDGPREESGLRLEQLNLDPGCFREVLFRKVPLTEEEIQGQLAGDMQLALGIYEEYVAEEGVAVEDAIAIADSQRIVLFGPSAPDSPIWNSKPSESCSWPRIEPADPNVNVCSDPSKCYERSLWRKSSSADVLERVQLRTELRRPSPQELLQSPWHAPFDELWIQGLYPDGSTDPEASLILLSPADIEKSCPHKEVVVSVPQRTDSGLDWRYRPLTGRGVKDVADLVPDLSCFEVGRGSEYVSLENDFVQVTELGRSSPLGFQFFDGQPWIFSRPEKASDEERVAGTIFLHANRAVAGFASIFDWLPEHLNRVKIRQVIGHHSDSCKAWWRGLGEIAIPLDCNIWGSFQPKGLCGEIVTHELTHELSARLLALTNADYSRIAGKNTMPMLWEALADYLAVSLQGDDGTYGAFCGDDFRSLEYGLYRPQLDRPRSMLEDRRIHSPSFKSLLISSALFDLAPALARTDLSLQGRPDLIAARLPAYRRTVDRMALLSFLLGGQDWQTFLDRLVELAGFIGQAEAVCSVLWDEHRLPVRGCADKTKTTLIDIESASLAGGNELQLPGSVWPKSICKDPEILIQTPTTTYAPVSLNNTFGQSKAEFLHSVNFPTKTDPADIIISVSIKCDGFTDILQRVVVNREQPYAGNLALRAPVQELLVIPAANQDIRLAVRDHSGWLTYLEATVNLEAAELEQINSWSPEQRVQPGWSLVDDRLTGQNLDGTEFDLDLDALPLHPFNQELLPDSEPNLPGNTLGPDHLRDNPDIPLPVPPKLPKSATLSSRNSVQSVRSTSTASSGATEAPPIDPGTVDLLAENVDLTNVPIELTDPPGLVLNPGRYATPQQEGEELISFPASSCRLPPTLTRGPDGSMAILTCDGLLKIRSNSSEEFRDIDLPRSLRILIPQALSTEDVDNDQRDELIVGPLAYGWGQDAIVEIRAYEWSGELVGGNWPIRTDLHPTVPAAFDHIDGDRCPEVILAADRIEIWNPSGPLESCRTIP